MSCSVLKRPSTQTVERLEWPQCADEGRSSDRVFTRGGASVEAADRARGRDAPAGEREAYQRGFREGDAEGARRTFDQFQAAIRAFTENAAALAGYKPMLRAEVERELVALSLAVARKVLRRELSIDPSIVLALVKVCFTELQNAEIYRLRLHPQDVEPVADYLRLQRRGGIELVPDPEIARGGAVFETSQGKLDARLDTQLLEIERGLADG